jgi:hypothetical protein
MPIWSICPASMMRGEPLGLSIAMTLPWTSVVIWSANGFMRLRTIRATGCSKPETEGVSSICLRNSNDSARIAGSLGLGMSARDADCIG